MAQEDGASTDGAEESDGEGTTEDDKECRKGGDDKGDRKGGRKGNKKEEDDGEESM